MTSHSIEPIEPRDLPNELLCQWERIDHQINEIPLSKLRAMPGYPHTLEAAWALWAAVDGEKRLHEYTGRGVKCFLGGASYGASSDYGSGVSGAGDTMQEAIYRAHLKLKAYQELTTGDDN